MTYMDRRRSVAALSKYRLYKVGDDVPTIVADFKRRKYLLSGEFVSFDDMFTHTRSSSATYNDANGNFVTMGSNVPRVGHHVWDGSRYVDRGLLMEGQRVNQFTYSVLSDAALQSMSQTLGTSVFIDGSGGGVTAEVIAVGEENGIPYLDWKLSGTNVSGGSLFFDIYDGSDVPSSEGDKDTVSAYLKLIESNIAPYSLQIYRHYRDANGNMVSPAGLSLFNSLTNTLERYTSTTTAPAGTAKVVNKGVFASVSAGNAVDFTIRVGLPQFEENSVATSPIKTSGSPATRAPDLLTMTNLSGLDNGFWVVLPKFALNGVDGAYDRVIQFDDGDNGNRQSALFDAGGHKIGISQWTGGAVAAATSRSYTLGDTTKIAMRLGPNKFAVVWEDGTIYEDTNCDYVTPDRMYIAASNASGLGKPAAMSLAGIMLHPPSITPAQMAAHLGGLS